VVVRPGEVWGPNSEQFVGRPLALMRRHFPVLVDAGRGLMAHCWIDNLVDGLVLALTHPDAVGGTFTFHDGSDTTTYRELIVLPEGGILIDTPGMREIEIWGDENGLSKAFDDIEELASQCRFNDCTHGNEPGCAVKKALETGELDNKRYQNYLKLQRELKRLALRRTGKEAHYQRMQGKKFSSMVKEVKKLKNFKRK